VVMITSFGNRVRCLPLRTITYQYQNTDLIQRPRLVLMKMTFLNKGCNITNEGNVRETKMASWHSSHTM
jgi:hypothetical protein